MRSPPRLRHALGARKNFDFDDLADAEPCLSAKRRSPTVTRFRLARKHGATRPLSPKCERPE
jgi:hypothetical protein